MDEDAASRVFRRMGREPADGDQGHPRGRGRLDEQRREDVGGECGGEAAREHVPVAEGGETGRESRVGGRVEGRQGQGQDEGILGEAQVGARATGDQGAHLVAHLPAGGPLSQSLHDTRALQTQDGGGSRGRRIGAPGLEEVRTVDAGRADADQDL